MYLTKFLVLQGYSQLGCPSLGAGLWVRRIQRMTRQFAGLGLGTGNSDSDSLARRFQLAVMGLASFLRTGTLWHRHRVMALSPLPGSYSPHFVSHCRFFATLRADLPPPHRRAQKDPARTHLLWSPHTWSAVGAGF